MFLFTDFILDENTKYVIGFMMVAIIGLFLILNLGLVIFFGAHALKLLYSRNSKIIKHKYFPSPPIVQTESLVENDKEEEKEEKKEEEKI